MKSRVGMWIDHREAIIVELLENGDEIKRIQSNVESQPRRAGDHTTGSFEAQAAPADDSKQREYTGDLSRYYDEIISKLHDSAAIFIFGPGESKGELKKRFEKGYTGLRTIVLETTDKMTQSQILAKVRHHFQSQTAIVRRLQTT